MGKSLVIETFEKRTEFYDDDVSPVIGYILVALSVILLIIGVYYLFEEYFFLELEPNKILLAFSKQLFIHMPLLIVFTPLGIYCNWTCYKFVKHS